LECVSSSKITITIRTAIYILHVRHPHFVHVAVKMIQLSSNCNCLMEINVEKTKVMRISRRPSPVTITIDKTTGECEMF